MNSQALVAQKQTWPTTTTVSGRAQAEIEGYQVKMDPLSAVQRMKSLRNVTCNVLSPAEINGCLKLYSMIDLPHHGLHITTVWYSIHTAASLLLPMLA